MNSCSSPKDEFTFPIIKDEFNCGCISKAKHVQNNITALEQSFVSGSVLTSAGRLPQVLSTLRRQDHWETIKARFGTFRMNYSVVPGLYALGHPDDNSPVLVTANYKMSFDRLRKALPGRDLWILVLDTKGINVWCAAGKGTFGTEELVRRIELSGLSNIVKHRKLILPQLGAAGVAAHKVAKLSGFKVQYGPIRAEDLPVYLDGGFKATAQMRIMNFPLKERAVLIPIELNETIKPFLIIASILLIISGIMGPAGFWANVAGYGFFAVMGLLCAIIGGTVFNALLLPYLPGRAFSLKGLSIGIVIALILLYLRGINLQTWPGRIETLSWLLIIPAISSYLAMNFTGCSTYTSLSGVKKEMRWALPFQITAGVGGLITWISAIFIA
ncbi:MAG: mercury methylation corrinoid protein HgcA [Deltaproteobacteria bacterium]|nr:mercury methylation corrinoid protein HgcA [Deltaproteobacteria bacterium]